MKDMLCSSDAHIFVLVWLCTMDKVSYNIQGGEGWYVAVLHDMYYTLK